MFDLVRITIVSVFSVKPALFFCFLYSPAPALFHYLSHKDAPCSYLELINGHWLKNLQECCEERRQFPGYFWGFAVNIICWWFWSDVYPNSSICCEVTYWGLSKKSLSFSNTLKKFNAPSYFPGSTFVYSSKLNKELYVMHIIRIKHVFECKALKRF